MSDPTKPLNPSTPPATSSTAPTAASTSPIVASSSPNVPTTLRSDAAIAPPAPSSHVTGLASTTAPPPDHGPSFDDPHGAQHVQHVPVGGAPEGGILAQASAMAKPYLEQVDKTTRPYLEKAQASAKPYADAAMAKGQELKEYLEKGKNQHGVEADAAGTAAVGRAGGFAAHTGAGTGAAGNADSTGEAGGPTAAQKAKGMFDYGLGTMKSALNTLGETIDSKTATPEKPGLYTQASTAASKGIASIQKAVAEVNSVDLATAYGHPSAGVAGAGVGAGVGASVAAGQAGTGVSAATGTGALATAAPVPTVGTSAAAPHPVMTTTNTVAHNSKDADPL